MFKLLPLLALTLMGLALLITLFALVDDFLVLAIMSTVARLAALFHCASRADG